MKRNVGSEKEVYKTFSIKNKNKARVKKYIQERKRSKQENKDN